MMEIIYSLANINPSLLDYMTTKLLVKIFSDKEGRDSSLLGFLFSNEYGLLLFEKIIKSNLKILDGITESDMINSIYIYPKTQPIETSAIRLLINNGIKTLCSMIMRSENFRLVFSSVGTYSVRINMPFPRTNSSTCMIGVPSGIASLQGHCTDPFSSSDANDTLANDGVSAAISSMMSEADPCPIS